MLGVIPDGWKKLGLIHAIPNVWKTQAYLYGWDFEEKSYRETCEMFERMEIAKHVYEGGIPSKITTREYANHVSDYRKHKGGESASPTNTKKILSSKRKKIMQAIRAIGRPVKNMLVAWTRTLYVRV